MTISELWYSIKSKKIVDDNIQITKINKLTFNVKKPYRRLVKFYQNLINDGKTRYIISNNNGK